MPGSEPAEHAPLRIVALRAVTATASRAGAASGAAFGAASGAPTVSSALPSAVSPPASEHERARLAEAAMELRRRVFVDEQRVAPELEFDGLDAEALHLVGLEHDEVVGVLRMLVVGDSFRIGRMAVRSERRRSGVGAALAAAALACARRQGASEAYVHAQTHAAGFYARLGFEPVGEPFEEAGIPHVEMRRVLAVTREPD